jgi:chemotaxis response regulator CheB
LEAYPRFEVCGEAVDGAKAIEEARKLQPDVVVLNVTMPVLNGFEAAREIKT